MNQKEPVVSIDRLGIEFILQHDRSFSIKETLIKRIRNLFRPQINKESFWALRDISFDVQPGETFGIIGENGSGKSVLLQILAGLYTPTEGKRNLDGKIATLIELGAGFQAEFTGAENLFLNAALLGLRRHEVEEKYDSIVRFSELEDFIDIPIKHYSSGMYLRLGFAIAIETSPDILLIDEILAVGDAYFQKKCLDKIQEFQRLGKTIILVSHSLDMVEQFCNRAMCLHKGRILSLGRPADVIHAYLNRHKPDSSQKEKTESSPQVTYNDSQLRIGCEAPKTITTAGELVNCNLSQTFTMPHNNLCELGLLFATYQRINNSNVFFHLEEIYPEQKEIITLEVDATRLFDNQWYYFSFPCVKDSAQRRYKFSIWTNASSRENAVTLWYNNKDHYDEEIFQWNELTRTGHLCFRALYLKI